MSKAYNLSPGDFHRAVADWKGSDPLAIRLEQKLNQARWNRRRDGLSLRRKLYWGRLQFRLERRMMRLFHINYDKTHE